MTGIILIIALFAVCLIIAEVQAEKERQHHLEEYRRLVEGLNQKFNINH